MLVSNDDGVKAPGLDALVKGLRKIPKVTVTVSAPADHKSATGGATTPGPLKAQKTTTKSGYPAVAVQGFPADSVNYALRTAARRARIDLVVTGINPGVNTGPVLHISGTIGAARAAARKGLPALAVSVGAPQTTVHFADGVREMTAWVKANRTKLKRGTVSNLNVPECRSGHPRGLVRAVSSSTAPVSSNFIPKVDCRQKTRVVKDEISNLRRGFATVTTIPLTDAAG